MAICSFSKLGVKTRSYDDKNLLPLPSDDVFHTEGFRQIAYSLEEAIAFHRETHHPTMFNKSNALIEAAVELDMRTKKKTKFVSEFSGILMFPHKFEIKTSRRIVAICKTLEQSDIAIQSGASIAGGSDIIRQIKSKKLTSTDFDHIVCHSDMLVELAEVRGVLRDHFPNKVKGNYGTDMQTLVTKFMESLDYKCTRDDIEPEFGCVESPFGSLDMDTDKLRENLIYFLNKVESHQPKDAPSCFIRRVLLKSKPSLEQFRIRHWDLLDGYEDPTQIDESEMKSGQKG
ncbi:39S ribosomal protein L1-like protein [Dinothrombium tinctorium]|uniref:39S ribosomal protein L1-like protein n=1 Tax=Dinothrombium tinctorium TaxID=1965070 RepID=A0A3S3QAR9_9ACAR|nr:39S ribosomal protein L1-like protein [Dinothrombium tinctorium]